MRPRFSIGGRCAIKGLSPPPRPKAPDLDDIVPVRITIKEAVDDVLAGLPRHGTVTFRQLTVMPLVYYRLYRGYYDDVSFRFVPLNVPPGGVYVCRGYRGPATA